MDNSCYATCLQTEVYCNTTSCAQSGETMWSIAKYLLVVGAILAVTLTALPAASAQPVATEKSKNCLAGYWYDNFGNDFHFTGKSGSCSASYTIKGKLYSSPYLVGTPWKVTGTGLSSFFNFTVHASKAGKAAGDCSFVYYGTVSGTPPTETASGNWFDLICSGSGTFTLTQTAAGPVMKFSGGEPGVAS